MERIDERDLEAKIFAAEMRENLPSLDLHPPVDPSQVEILVDQFLYKNLQENEDAVAIIYGAGTGRLKKIVLEILAKHPLVTVVKDKSGHCLVLLEKIDN